MKKIIIGFAALSALFISKPALAVCPICTIAVGAGVGFSRWLGIDDTIIGLWVGGLIVSLALWTINWLIKRNYNFLFRSAIVVVGYYALVIGPLFYSQIIGHPLNILWGTDKIVLGTAIGSAVFFFGERLYAWLKIKNGGQAHFPFEKIVLPVAPLIVASFIFFFLTK